MENKTGSRMVDLNDIEDFVMIKIKVLNDELDFIHKMLTFIRDNEDKQLFDVKNYIQPMLSEREHDVKRKILRLQDLFNFASDRDFLMTIDDRIDYFMNDGFRDEELRKQFMIDSCNK